VDAKERLNNVSDGIIGAAIAVHYELGPGLLESAYEACLAFELESRGFGIERQKPLPLVYREVVLDCAYRMDLVVNDEVIVEIKSVERINAVHKAQMLSQLRLYKRCLGLLLNFNVKWFAEGGITRIVHNFPE
jgi:GxxExxY protein